MQDFTFENLNILRYLFKSKQSIMRKIVPLERLCWEGRLSRWLAPPSGRAHPCAYSHLPTYIAYNVFSAKYNPTCQTLGTDIRGTCRWRRSGRRHWQSWGARRRRTWRSMYLAWSASGSSICKLSNFYQYFIFCRFWDLTFRWGWHRPFFCSCSWRSQTRSGLNISILCWL